MSTVGSGSYSTVTKVPGRNIVVKTFKKPDDPCAIQEICILKYMQHKNIVSVASVSIDENDYWKLYMRAYETDLQQSTWRDSPTRHPTAILSKIAIDVAAGINYMAQNHIVHCDIKPANILFDPIECTSVICDFNISIFNPVGKLKTHVQTQLYRAPEVDFEAGIGMFDSSIDIFSYGCVLYQLLTNKILITNSRPDSTYGACDIASIDISGTRNQRLIRLHEVKSEQMVVALTNKVKKTHWRQLNNINFMHNKKAAEFISNWFKLMVGCLMPSTRLRSSSNTMMMDAKQLWEFFDPTTEYVDESPVGEKPISMCFGTSSIVTNSMAEISEGLSKYTNDPKQLHIAKYRTKWYSDVLAKLPRSRSLWLSMIEVNYYRTLGRKKVNGSVEAIIITLAALVIINSIAKLHTDVYNAIVNHNAIAGIDAHAVKTKSREILRALDYNAIV